MIIVLDASAAIEIALNNMKSEKYRNLLKESDLVIAPDTFPSEITNVFWKYTYFSKMPFEQCEKGIEYCLDLIDDYIETRVICREVFAESIKNEHSSYDLFYLIVARRHNAAILSRDKKMNKIAEELGIKRLDNEA
jgi:predicted nucleic acid-binding protein